MQQLDFINLFINSDESVCLSPNKYGYHSVAVSEVEDCLLISPSGRDTYADLGSYLMMGINPINGFKKDANVIAYRSFLVELDSMSLDEQRLYVNEKKLPYSVCVFSGNKSLHYGIVLDEDLANSQEWYYLNEWMLNILEMADQANKSPSRGIRFPGNIRTDGKKLKQALIELNGRIKKNDFINWLNLFPEKKPRQKKQEVVYNRIRNNVDKDGIPGWIHKRLQEGISVNRNNSWFSIAAAMSVYVGSDGELEEVLYPFFSEDKDFKMSEWKGVIKSAYKKVHG